MEDRDGIINPKKYLEYYTKSGKYWVAESEYIFTDNNKATWKSLDVSELGTWKVFSDLQYYRIEFKII